MKVELAYYSFPRSSKRTALIRWPIFTQKLHEFFPVGGSYSNVLFRLRFFYNSEPTSLSQTIAHLHAEFTEPPDVTHSKLVWEKKY